MKKIGLQYSNDNGATWSTAIEVDCLEVVVWEQVDTDIEQTTLTKRKLEDINAYIFVKLVFDYQQFDPATSDAATSNTLWKSIFTWSKAKLRRIYNANISCYPTLTGYDTFNSNPNTNYVVIEDSEVAVEPFEQVGDTHYHRYITIQLSTRDKV